MNYNNFDFVKIEKNKKLSNLSDYNLVKLTQEDVDQYRNKCYWKCPKCGYKMKYSFSLYVTGKKYIHETRCPNANKRRGKYIECRHKMVLDGSEDGFDSIYFNELFARYQDRIIWESKKSFAVDSPDEIYSILISSFLKIVLQFDRDENKFKSKSDKWFSSFFWRSVQNKIADLQKTNTYNKRCPVVKCEICGKEVGQISSKHLYKSGHEVIWNEIYRRHGFSYLKIENPHIEYNIDVNLLNKKSISTGRKILEKLSKKELKNIFDSECLDIYSCLFPNSMFRNHISSISQSEDENIEFLDFLNTDVVDNRKVLIEELDIDNNIKILSDIILEEGEGNFYNYISKDIDSNELKNIIQLILIDKIYHDRESDNVLLDKNFDCIYNGFTEALIDFIRSNKRCRICLGMEENKELIHA